MRFDVMTLFPEMFETFIQTSIIGRAIELKKIIEINTVNIRDFSVSRQKKVDDAPYGGGNGVVMTFQPIYDTYKHLIENSHMFKETGIKPKVIYMSPQGKTLTQKMCHELADNEQLIILCGHYEGVDERIIEEIVDMEISVGDYVLTGGELPAMVLMDSVARLVPGVLSKEDCFIDESHSEGLLEYPQYTRPEVICGRAVPEVLLSGHHENIEKWRKEQSIIRTRSKRPDIVDVVDKD